MGAVAPQCYPVRLSWLTAWLRLQAVVTGPRGRASGRFMDPTVLRDLASPPPSTATTISEPTSPSMGNRTFRTSPVQRRATIGAVAGSALLPVDGGSTMRIRDVRHQAGYLHLAHGGDLPPEPTRRYWFELQGGYLSWYREDRRSASGPTAAGASSVRYGMGRAGWGGGGLHSPPLLC